VSDGHARETPYREEQNVIKNSISGDIVYMPPTAKDVPSLMADLIAWLDDELTSNKLPIPLVAG
jgi:Fic family protein